jgi:hypothetical protein
MSKRQLEWRTDNWRLTIDNGYLRPRPATWFTTWGILRLRCLVIRHERWDYLDLIGGTSVNEFRLPPVNFINGPTKEIRRCVKVFEQSKNVDRRRPQESILSKWITFANDKRRSQLVSRCVKNIYKRCREDEYCSHEDDDRYRWPSMQISASLWRDQGGMIHIDIDIDAMVDVVAAGCCVCQKARPTGAECLLWQRI